MEQSYRLMLSNLQKRLPLVEPAAILVEPRILRRVIRLDRRLPGFNWKTSHRKSYIIGRDRLLAFVDRAELGLSPGVGLPPLVILLLLPDEEELAESGNADHLLYRYARLLYHAMIHAQLRQHFMEQRSPAALAEERRRQIGETEFSEIHSVLLSDELIFPESDTLETYIEFASEYLELRQFTPDELPLYFPAIRDWDAIERIVGGDVDHQAILERLERLDSDLPQGALAEEGGGFVPPNSNRLSLTLLEFRRFQARAERYASLGNSVKSAVTHMRAARRAPSGYAEEAEKAALEELAGLARRLQKSQNLSDEETTAWYDSLCPLLAPAAEGFWPNEARLLYDLQKVCYEHERGVNRFDLIDWIRTWGQRPIYRPLPLLREVLMVRHLRTARRRLLVSRITSTQREELDSLLAVLVELAETQTRNHLRSIVSTVLDEVGLVPQNVPEAVARRKLVEELLDRIIEHSYLNMGDLRDSISKNDFKLPDVENLGELLTGDVLLQADKKLDAALDGVYRRGAVYLRWPQTLSSVAFGTRPGRFITQHIAVPFGGAFLTMEFFRHVVHWITGKKEDGHAPVAKELLPPEEEIFMADTAAPPEWSFLIYIFLLGLWIHNMVHWPSFRAWTVSVFIRGFRLAKNVFYDWPNIIWHSQFIQRIRNSQIYAALWNYLFRPGWITSIAWLGWWLFTGSWLSFHPSFELFLLSSLFLNSPIGRVTIEVTGDFMVRAWHELRFRVMSALFQAVMSLFHSLIVTVERIVYTVDEWLRFRSGDSRISQVFKLLGGVVWFFVGYMVVFVFTLLVEPQINPIKHFPVVTVSHKLIIPMGPTLTRELAPYFGAAQAATIAWTVIFLIPGVFGFLVWELKENWRLYAANRSKRLRHGVIGSHGESMLQLLRVGFHSGTVPKAYRDLRRAARKAENGKNQSVLYNKQVALHHVETEVHRFVERELTFLLEESSLPESAVLRVSHVHLATNRIEVELYLEGNSIENLTIVWDYAKSPLTGITLHDNGALRGLSEQERSALVYAITGLFHRSCVDKTRGDLAISVIPPIFWTDWVSYWTFRPETPAGTAAGETPDEAPDHTMPVSPAPADSSESDENLEQEPETKEEANLIELTSSSNASSLNSSGEELNPPPKM